MFFINADVSLFLRCAWMAAVSRFDVMRISDGIKFSSSRSLLERIDLYYGFWLCSAEPNLGLSLVWIIMLSPGSPDSWVGMFSAVMLLPTLSAGLCCLAKEGLVIDTIVLVTDPFMNSVDFIYIGEYLPVDIIAVWFCINDPPRAATTDRFGSSWSICERLLSVFVQSTRLLNGTITLFPWVNPYVVRVVSITEPK